MKKLQKLIVICGPTAVGKTKVAISLALELNGEIVSADSQQVWKEFSIGTAKPSEEERKLIPHHLIDVVPPDEGFDAAKFVKLADDAIADVASRGRTPFIVGGTGMYIKMLIHGLCDAPPKDDEFRKELQKEIKEKGLKELHTRLSKCDPSSAARIKEGDTTRIIRALEIFHVTGAPASSLRTGHLFAEKRYDAKKIGLNIARDELYKKINARVDEMMANGLVEEVRLLLKRYDADCQPFKAVGYKEMVQYLNDEMSLDAAIELIKKNTRNFAKRQLTWFRADKEIKWFGPEEIDVIARSLKSDEAIQ